MGQLFLSKLRQRLIVTIFSSTGEFILRCCMAQGSISHFRKETYHGRRTTWKWKMDNGWSGYKRAYCPSTGIEEKHSGSYIRLDKFI